VNLFVQLDNNTDTESMAQSTGTLNVSYTICANSVFTTVRIKDDSDRDPGLEQLALESEQEVTGRGEIERVLRL